VDHLIIYPKHRVVNNDAGASIMLWSDAYWADPHVQPLTWVLHELTEGQDHPLALLDELHKFPLQEFGKLMG
jgi:hypothetical protein